MEKSLREILWHSLGMKKSNYRRRMDWWLDEENHRNHFAADTIGTDRANIAILVERGHMMRGRDIPGGLVYFHVTDDGIKVARDEFRQQRSKS